MSLVVSLTTLAEVVFISTLIGCVLGALVIIAIYKKGLNRK